MSRKVKLSDYVAEFFSDKGVRQCFCVTGGGAMHLNDSLGSSQEIQVLYNHHEQACAMAAEGYAKVSKIPALVSVTSGPGAMNALTGVYGAYTDSVPMIIISGQMKSSTLKGSDLVDLRYLGFQEAEIIPVVAGFTKYARLVSNPGDIFFHLEAAWDKAMNGRKGPVWLDVPLDIQGAEIEVPVNRLSRYVSSEGKGSSLVGSNDLTSLKSLLESSSRPVLMVGEELQSSSETLLELRRCTDFLKIPVVTEWNAHDLVQDSDPHYCGRPGTIGDRGGNYVVQTADLVIAVGCQLSIRQISYEWENFARDAKLVYVHSDASELQKKTLSVDLPILSNLDSFLRAITQISLANVDKYEWKRWLRWSREINAKYPVCLPEYYASAETLNAYPFFDQLSTIVEDGTAVVLANGAACVVGLQAFRIRSRVRLFTNSGASSMGYGLAASLGAALSPGVNSTVCVEGDGSIMMNLQELQTVVDNDLNIKIFILNNGGYHSIRQTQKNLFNAEERGYFGADNSSGLGLPDFEKIAFGFGVPYERIVKIDELPQKISHVLSSPSAIICEVFIDPNQDFAPKLTSKLNDDGTFSTPSLEYMAPFLEESELEENKYKK